MSSSSVGVWGVALGGAIALSVQILVGCFAYYRSKAERDWKKLDYEEDIRRGRGEELHILLQKWFKLTGAGFFHYPMVMRGQIDYNAALDAVINGNSKSDIEVEKIGFLIDVYFPQIGDDFDRLKRLLQQANAIEHEYKEVYKNSGPYLSEQHANEYEQKLVEAEKQSDLLLKNLSKIIRDMTIEI